MSSYLERMQDIVEEAKQEVKDKKKVVKYSISEKEIEFAKALYDLMQNSSFKKFLELENYEIGDLMTQAFNKPSEGDFQSNNFGEQMAFNKGRYIQMMRFRARREELLRRYIYLQENNSPVKE